jgi:hypothetical protein
MRVDRENVEIKRVATQASMKDPAAWFTGAARLICLLAAITAHDVPLIATIAVSLGFAFAGGWLTVGVRLPPLDGYQ